MRTATQPVLRVGLVGLGWFGKQHWEAWESIPQAKVCAACDLRPSIARSNAIEAQSAFHKDAASAVHTGSTVFAAPCYASLEEMLAAAQIDLVDIVATEAAHCELALTALRAGKHVIVEKPFALSVDEATSIVRVARERGLKVYVGNILRFDARYRSCMDSIARNGESIRHMSFSRHFQTAAHEIYGRVDPFFGAMIHDIDIALGLVGRAPDSVLAEERRFLGRKNADDIAAILGWKDGPIAVLQNSWHLQASCPAGFSFETTIITDKSTHIIRTVPVVEVHSASAVSWPEYFLWPSIGGDRSGALRQELAHFAACALHAQDSHIMPLQHVVAGIAAAERLRACVDHQQKKAAVESI